jgi:hypothetical protein
MANGSISRRLFLSGTVGTLVVGEGSVSAQPVAPPPEYSLPIGWPDRVLGDGFSIRHGYACENTWYNPGYWHTGEDWYAVEGETGGASIYAIGDGAVVFVGSDYPGRVVIVQHEDELFSMYGHLDYAVAVNEGDAVQRGDLLGAVLLRTDGDGNAPSHLHFEVRTFLMTAEVNGDAPRYDFACGYQCAPGPGYWPMDAPEHPSAMGWRNPFEVVAGSLQFEAGVKRIAVAATAANTPASLWTLPSDHDDALLLGEFSLDAGEEFQFFGVATRDPASIRTSAEAYRIWYSIALPDGTRGWIQAVSPDSGDVGSDGRPSSLRINLLPQATGYLP